MIGAALRRLWAAGLLRRRGEAPGGELGDLALLCGSRAVCGPCCSGEELEGVLRTVRTPSSEARPRPVCLCNPACCAALEQVINRRFPFGPAHRCCRGRRTARRWALAEHRHGHAPHYASGPCPSPSLGQPRAMRDSGERRPAVATGPRRRPDPGRRRSSAWRPPFAGKPHGPLQHLQLHHGRRLQGRQPARSCRFVAWCSQRRSTRRRAARGIRSACLCSDSRPCLSMLLGSNVSKIFCSFARSMKTWRPGAKAAFSLRDGTR